MSAVTEQEVVSDDDHHPERHVFWVFNEDVTGISGSIGLAKNRPDGNVWFNITLPSDHWIWTTSETISPYPVSKNGNLIKFSSMELLPPYQIREWKHKCSVIAWCIPHEYYDEMCLNGTKTHIRRMTDWLKCKKAEEEFMLKYSEW